MTFEHSLDNLLENLKYKSVENYCEQKIKNITNHSKEVEERSIFVAIKGFNKDGHLFIQEAIKKGAEVIIGEKNIDSLNIPANITYIQVNSARQAFAGLNACFFGYPADKMKMIGITGSAGKTTISFMLDSIFSYQNKNTGLISTLYTKVGNNLYENPNKCTTPHASYLQNKLAEMYENNIKYVPMEVSSHALKLNRVYGINYDIAIFTNLSYDHINFHENVTDYFQSKAKLFNLLKENGFGVVNIDDKYGKKIKNSNPCYTYGINSKKALIKGENLKMGRDNLRFTVNIKSKVKTLNNKIISPQKFELNLPIIGYQNVYNGLAAFTTGLLLDIPLEKIREGLKNFEGVDRRMEIIYDKDFMVIDDFAHNPISIETTFKSISQLEYNELVLLHFLKGKRGVKANVINAKIFNKWKGKLKIKNVIATEAQNNIIKKNRVLEKEKNSFINQVDKSEIVFSNYTNLKPAIKQALNTTKKNDLLLLLGGPGLSNAKNIIQEILEM